MSYKKTTDSQIFFLILRVIFKIESVILQKIILTVIFKIRIDLSQIQTSRDL